MPLDKHGYLSILFIVFLTATFFSCASSAGEFHKEPGYFWADTPQGRFECKEEGRGWGEQVLRLDGQEIYRAQAVNDFPTDNVLTEGIRADKRCPTIRRHHHRHQRRRHSRFHRPLGRLCAYYTQQR